MTTTTKLSLTLEEFLCLPETEPASEYIDGEVIQKPMPKFTHATLQMYLLVLLAEFLCGKQLGFTGAELRCVFGVSGRPRAYVPDVVFVARAKITVKDMRELDDFRNAPDLAIEVLSPRQPKARFAEKLSFYLANGVRLVWVIDPIAETVQVLTPGEPARLLSAADTLDGGAVLPGFSTPLSDLFAQLRLD